MLNTFLHPPSRSLLKVQWDRVKALIAELGPKGLYTRALIIIIAPILLLEMVMTFFFLEKHWQAVTRRLSDATAREIAALVEFYESYPLNDNHKKLIELARDRLNFSLQILPAGELPAARPKPFFDLLDTTLSEKLREQIRRPFWIDTVGQSSHVEIRVKLDTAVLRIIAIRSQTYASNSHIFIVWMIATAAVLLTVAILFLRNQIKPILRLAEAADAFGKGRPVPADFRPRGAREVRQAAQAFIEMRDRIKIHVDQRTTMLAGVSHDLRTILTRFRLQLAILGDTKEVEDLTGDVNEMQLMLEDYLAFTKGDGGEEAIPTNVRDIIEELAKDAQPFGVPIEVDLPRWRTDMVLPLKRHAFKRALTNLVNNAIRFADEKVSIRAQADKDWLRVEVEDDGPGIPVLEREQVFRPFYRLDHARNQDEGNTGLGLAITRDIVRGHGGEITLDSSPLGGLKAIVRVPI